MQIPHMLIGGNALPAYGQIRATQDLDLAIAVEYSDEVKLRKHLKQLGYQLPSEPDEKAPVFFVTDLENMTEIELWTKPDGVTFDEELLHRRIEVRPFSDDFKIFVIGPEDFIVNKLARKDRGVQDEQDVVSVLKLQKDNLDYAYLEKRAKAANTVEILATLMMKVT
jgi:predicted nucleotidyltransferase